MENTTERSFVNIYIGDDGRFISECDYDSYDEAYKNRDKTDNYLETVEILRKIEGKKS